MRDCKTIVLNDLQIGSITWTIPPSQSLRLAMTPPFAQGGAFYVRCCVALFVLEVRFANPRGNPALSHKKEKAPCPEVRFATPRGIPRCFIKRKRPPCAKGAVGEPTEGLVFYHFVGSYKSAECANNLSVTACAVPPPFAQGRLFIYFSFFHMSLRHKSS